jgi:hypothetical protein
LRALVYAGEEMDCINPEDGGSKLLQNTGNYIPLRMVLYPRRLEY